MFLRFFTVLAVASVVLCQDAFRQPPTDPPRGIDNVKEKRALCTDKDSDCAVWKSQGDCESGHEWYQWMIDNCKKTCGFSCDKPPTQAPVGPVGSNQNCLQAHNAKRALHGASPLVWDDTLAQHAKAWADHLLTLGKMEHAEGTGEGENLFWGSGKAYTCVDAVESWYSEVKDYNFNSPPKTIAEFNKPPATGHFTQVVWKESTKLGVALATKQKGGTTETYIVARYSPPGNYLGQFSQNVGRKTS